MFLFNGLDGGEVLLFKPLFPKLFCVCVCGGVLFNFWERTIPVIDGCCDNLGNDFFLFNSKAF